MTFKNYDLTLFMDHHYVIESCAVVATIHYKHVKVSALLCTFRDSCNIPPQPQKSIIHCKINNNVVTEKNKVAVAALPPRNVHTLL